MKIHPLVLAFLLFLSACHFRTPKPVEMPFYDRVEWASVEVLVNGHLEASGWFASADGLVVTAAHAFGFGAKDAWVEVVHAGVRQGAKLVALDRAHDLALLQTPPREPHSFLSVATDWPKPSDEVFGVGSPMFRHGLMLTGRVARSRTSYEYVPTHRHHARVFYITGPAPHGLSGGPWVNKRGEVVGNQSGLIWNNNAAVGIGYAAPREAIANLVRTKKSAVTAELGVIPEELWEQPQDFLLKYLPGQHGLVPAIVVDGSGAKQAGLTKETLITEADGKKMVHRDDLIAHVRTKKPGDEVELTLLDPGSTTPRVVKVKLGELDNSVPE